MLQRSTLYHSSEVLSGAHIRHEQWIEYQDENGRGYAEIDGLAVKPGFILLFELKRTYTARGLVQLGQLYMPLLYGGSQIKPDFPASGLPQSYGSGE